MKLLLLGSLAVLLVWSSSATQKGDFLDEKDSDDVARALGETDIDLIWYECKTQCGDNGDYDEHCIAECVIKGLIDSGKRAIESPQKRKDARFWTWGGYNGGHNGNTDNADKSVSNLIGGFQNMNGNGNGANGNFRFGR
ncbi:hypothetical protein DPMN_048918 [Dreissena polymorpha]|uniref:Uncharacterized protein n=1 Tax=Dreissena polymorpha TaxID=45954 RepID=A0A9D4I4D5_DREPO|nr:hypothetical protein DPMN_048918 [Dreissena polymorpha]